jgi:uncharacterized caspase-like protein
MVSQSSDILIFFFSGHGERIDQEVFLLPVDTNAADLQNTAIVGSVLPLLWT